MVMERKKYIWTDISKVILQATDAACTEQAVHVEWICTLE